MNPDDGSADDLEGLLAQGRGAFVEILPAGAPARKVAECLAAFANAKGGAVVLQLSPSPDAEAQVEAARQTIREAALLCDPPLILPVPRVSRRPGPRRPRPGRTAPRLRRAGQVLRPRRRQERSPRPA